MRDPRINTAALASSLSKGKYPYHAADIASEEIQAKLAAVDWPGGKALVHPVSSPLTGERNNLISPYTVAEEAAMRTQLEASSGVGGDAFELSEGAAPSSLIDVVVPEGCTPGMEFAVSIEGTTFNVTVPDGVSPGETITVEDLAGALTLSLDEEVLKRLCIANEVHCSSKATRQIDRDKELLQRLQSVAKHGRPGPCPRCESILRVVSDDDGLRLECPMWRGGQGHRKPCGACAMPRSLAGRPAY